MEKASVKHRLPKTEIKERLRCAARKGQRLHLDRGLVRHLMNPRINPPY